ncbi:uncharacterized protein (DUF885 family) [Nakamurella sp. UYEF19]|uniref:DUF885 domain-containing protein n=1 Tax=Nakamurella sp. UYEF19 TaxID=1756392 RepID=UPI00339833AD
MQDGRPPGEAAGRDIAHRYLESIRGLDPSAAQALGQDPPSLIPDLGPEAFAQRRAADGRALAEISTDLAGDPLTTALAERLTADTALYDSGFTTSLLAPLATPVHLLRQVFDDLPADSEDDWVRIADHLTAAATGYSRYSDTLGHSARGGHRVAARQVHGMATAVDSWIDPAGTDFYRRLVRGFSGSPSLRARLVAAADQVSAAAAGFAEFLRRELLPGADQSDAVGSEMYQVTSSAFLGADVDLDELYQYGWSELRRLTTAAASVAKRATGTDDLPSARQMLDRFPGATVAVGDELVRWLQDRLDSTFEALQGRHFDIPERGAPVRAAMVTAGSGVMYYAPADQALTRPGRVWWSVPPGTTTVPTWREVSSIHHEGLPGHHLQFAVTSGLEHLHPWQRNLCHVHGYAEGWAHYAEQLAVELGLVRGDAEYLGVLDAQIWRAARIVIDLGLHTGRAIPGGTGLLEERDWTPDVAVEFLARTAGIDRATAAFEVERYLGWPGQALAFKVGARLLDEVRTSRQRLLGSDFDLRAFHRDLLSLGPMGLAPLRKLLSGADTRSPRHP